MFVEFPRDRLITSEVEVEVEAVEGRAVAVAPPVAFSEVAISLS
jgi:hypothetical protein